MADTTPTSPPPLKLGYTPCPNDTFIFHALVSGLIPTGNLKFQPRLHDVETLNRLAQGATFDVTKISYGSIPYLLEDYVLLRSGGALGRGCGPLLVARSDIPLKDLRHEAIAVPGRFTTANLLLHLFDPKLPEGLQYPYHEIMSAVQRGQAKAGLIIHESRFTYTEHGLVKLLDLGQWWEKETGLPIPLGGILARRSLGEHTIRAIDRAIQDSVRYAFDHPAASRAYVREHAQELDEQVTRQHIDLYVNQFSLDLGDEGERAVNELFERALRAGIIPSRTKSPLLPKLDAL